MGKTSLHSAQSTTLGWDFEDSFTDDNWTTTAANNPVVDTSGREIDYNVPSTAATANTSYIDMLGEVVSNTAWVLRFPNNVTTFAHNTDGTNKSFAFGISSTTTNLNDAQNFLGLFQTTWSGADNISNCETDGVGLLSGDDSVYTHNLQAEQVYYEFIRQSATTATSSMFSNSGYSTLVEKLDFVAILSTVDNLRYLKATLHQGDNTCLGSLIGEINETVQFANGVTVAP